MKEDGKTLQISIVEKIRHDVNGDPYTESWGTTTAEALELQAQDPSITIIGEPTEVTLTKIPGTNGYR